MTTIQARAEIDSDTVNEYAEAEDAGETLPPVDVFWDGAMYYLADGFHRFKAKKKRKQTRIECIVHQGSMRDAKIFAARSNQQHGLRRTNADKRRAVEMLLSDNEWAGKSDVEIAEACGVSNRFVANLRPATLNGSKSDRTGRDGRKQKASSAKRSAAQKQRHAGNGDAAAGSGPSATRRRDEQEPDEPDVVGDITAMLDGQPADVLKAVRDWINERLSK